jgi:nucleoside-diphosphate-sugar epimerase
MKKALVTGATGFTGSHVVPRLIERGYRVRCLVRPSSDKSVLKDHAVEWISGDLEDRSALLTALTGADVLINIASIGFGHAPNIVKAAQESGLKRVLFISTTAIFTSLNATSKAVRLSAEKSIIDSGLEYTILRPTMIYGTSRDRNICRLIQYLKRWPIIFVVGNGEFLQQPIYVGDVVQAIVAALETNETIYKSYNIGGAVAITFNQMIDLVCKGLNRYVLKINIPSSPVVAGLRILEKAHIRLPIKSEQILRLNENKNFEYDEAAKDFGFAPMTFVDGIRLELKDMGF